MEYATNVTAKLGHNGDDSGMPKSAGEIVDRRSGIDRRNLSTPSQSDLDRRRGPGRRRTDFLRAAEEGEMNDEQFEFLLTIDSYKRENKKPFPTWTEVLDVIKAMGYRKVAEPQSIHSFTEEPELQTA